MDDFALDFTASVPAAEPDTDELAKQAVAGAGTVIDLLERVLEAGKMDAVGWKLLAGLYLGTDRLGDFASLQSQYQSVSDAPILAHLPVSEPPPRPDPVPVRVTFQMPQRIMHDSLPEVAAVVAACASPDGALLDFSHVRGADSGGLKSLTRFLAQLPRDSTKPVLQGIERFISSLEKTAASPNGTHEMWDTLFEYQRCCNNNEVFEELAVAFAIRFGISPPSW